MRKKNVRVAPRPAQRAGRALAADGSVVVRALRPGARSVTVVSGDRRFPLDRRRDGLFAGTLPEIRARTGWRPTTATRRHVRRPVPVAAHIGELDLHLIGEGRHERLWDVLGAQVRTYDSADGPITGVSFAVWAPNAQGVRVTGDFDGWDGRANPMRSLGSSGVWEIFMPGVPVGSRYKFRILGQDGQWHEKADPMAFATEVPPATASIVTRSTYEWDDADWLAAVRDPAGRRADEHLRGAPRVVADGLGYRELASNWPTT